MHCSGWEDVSSHLDWPKPWAPTLHMDQDPLLKLLILQPCLMLQGQQMPTDKASKIFSPPNPQLACSYGGPLLIPSCLGSVKASLYRGMGSHSLSSSQELHFLSVLFAIHRIIPFPFCKIIPTSILHALLSPSLKHTKQSSLDPTVL